jgi:non-heme chloroperoxidase
MEDETMNGREPVPHGASRREFLTRGAAFVAVAALPGRLPIGAGDGSTVLPSSDTRAGGRPTKERIVTKDGTEIFYKDWGNGQPIVFHHGWPLSGDEWDSAMMYFLQRGYRVIAHDRRGHGRSSQSATGHDMDTYVADVAELTTALDLRDAIHVGHSTGGGEAARYVARQGKGRVARAVLISAIPPLMLKTPANPGGVPVSIFDDIRAGTGFNRAQYNLDLTLPFYGYNRPGANVLDGVRRNWWRQAMEGSVLAHYLGIKAFSETDFTEDLKVIDVPTLVLHGEDDQIVPFANSGPKTAKLIRNAKFKAYPGYPHGMPTTHADEINADILAFIQGPATASK